MRISPINSIDNMPKQKAFVSMPVFGCNRYATKHLLQTETPKDIYQNGLKKVLQSIFGLSRKDIRNLEEEAEIVRKRIEADQEKLLAIGRVLDYDRLRKSGTSRAALSKFIEQDDSIIAEATETVLDKNKATEHYFGYPINLPNESAVLKYLKHKELELPLLNNCADTYEQGNSQLNSKEQEKKLLNRLYRHFGLEEPTTTEVLNPKTNKYERQHIGAWGYITSGGSESNRWGIENGLKKLSGGHVYYSQATHYSVDKSVNIGTDKNGNDIKTIEHTIIPTQINSEKIDTDILLDEIRKNWTKKQEPAVILLTWGTTKTGAIDDVRTISQALIKEKIPHYIHLDAALSGGIPTDQAKAPQTPNIKQLGVDSVSVSLHKYFGHDEVKSVLVAQEKPDTTVIDYIGQGDGTTAGSRSHKPFSALQRVIETLDRSQPKDYVRNIQKFVNLLDKYKIPYTREKNANTFVIDKPSEEICRKYQLSTFTLPVTDTKTGKTVLKEKAHIIIFPHHKEDIMKELVEDLAKK